MLNSHFFSSFNSTNFLSLSKNEKCHNHILSYLFLLRYAEIQKGKCNNSDFLSYQFLLRILSACGERMYSSTICFHLRRQSQPLKKLWTFLILAMSGSSSSSLFSPLNSIRLMSFQLKTLENCVISKADVSAIIVHILILSWKLINLIDFSGENCDEEEDPNIAKIKKVLSYDGKANFDPF